MSSHFRQVLPPTTAVFYVRTSIVQTYFVDDDDVWPSADDEKRIGNGGQSCAVHVENDTRRKKTNYRVQNMTRVARSHRFIIDRREKTILRKKTNSCVYTVPRTTRKTKRIRRNKTNIK